MCKYCSTKSFDDYIFHTEDLRIPDKYGYELYIVGNEIHFDNSDDEYSEGVAKINYCPMCGRKL